MPYGRCPTRSPLGVAREIYFRPNAHEAPRVRRRRATASAANPNPSSVTDIGSGTGVDNGVPNTANALSPNPETSIQFVPPSVEKAKGPIISGSVKFHIIEVLDPMAISQYCAPPASVVPLIPVIICEGWRVVIPNSGRLDNTQLWMNEPGRPPPSSDTNCTVAPLAPGRSEVCVSPMSICVRSNPGPAVTANGRAMYSPGVGNLPCIALMGVADPKLLNTISALTAVATTQNATPINKTSSSLFISFPLSRLQDNIDPLDRSQAL